MIYYKSTKEAAKKLHQEARDKGHTALSYLMVFRAYKARGHNDESFLLNMEFRAIYSELCTLDDIDIVNENKQLGEIMPDIKNTYLNQGFSEEQSSLLASMPMQIDFLQAKKKKLMREDGVTTVSTPDMIVKLQRKAVEAQDNDNRQR